MSAEPLVHGKKVDPPDTSWCKFVAGILTRAVTIPPSSIGPTLAAETGLGIGSSVYWYVRRVHHDNNHVVLLHRIDRSTARATDRGACPFDTGALWSGWTIVSGLAADEKRAYFERHDRPILEGLDAFPSYIARNYSGDLGAYDDGAQPSTDIPEVCGWTKRDSRWPPWTWEVRVAKDRLHDVVSLVGVVWRREDASRFDRWVDDESGLGRDDAEHLLARVADAELLCGPAEQPRQRAQRAIREWR